MFKDLKIASFLGYKSIVKGNKATIVLIVFILSLAFVNQIFISAILNGIVDALNKQIVSNIVSNIIISPQEYPTRKDYISHASELQSQIEKIPGVVATSRRYNMAGSFSYDKEKNGKLKYVSGQIIAIDPEQERKMSDISKNIISGSYLENPGNEEILLGVNTAGGAESESDIGSMEGVKVGEKVKVAFNNGATREYKVKGIFKVKFEEVDRMAFITIKEAESIFSVYDNASQILVKTDGNEEKYLSRIQALDKDLKVRPWGDYSGPMGGITESFNMITLIISVIGVIVAAITIFIMIYVNVVNKRRQIGILKAIGIKQNIIICSYIFQALFYVIPGVIFGLLIIFYVLTPFFVKYPLQLPIGDSGLVLDNSNVFYAVVSLFAAALVAGFVPSWQTAKEDILKAIWGS